MAKKHKKHKKQKKLSTYEVLSLIIDAAALVIAAIALFK